MTNEEENTCYFTTEEKTLGRSEKNKLEDNGLTHTQHHIIIININIKASLAPPPSPQPSPHTTTRDTLSHLYISQQF